MFLPQPQTVIYELHECLHFETLATRRAKKTTKEVFRSLQGLSATVCMYLPAFLTPYQAPDRMIRCQEAGNIVIPRYGTHCGRRTFGSRGSASWNGTLIIKEA